MISNVPGPDFALYFAGMKMVAAYPLGPVVDGVALNITVQSYNDTLFVGLNACAGAVPDLPALARSIDDELGHMTGAAENAYDRMGSIVAAGPLGAIGPAGELSGPATGGRARDRSRRP